MVHLDAVADNILGIIGTALLEGAPEEALDHHVVVGLQFHHGVHVLLTEHGIQGAHLVEVARVAIQEETGGRIGFAQALLHHLVGDGIRNQLALFRIGGRQAPEFILGLGVRAEQVTGGNRRDTVALRDTGRLGAFARARGANQNQTY